MARRILTCILIALSLLFTSCYPKLSVQQYDQLKKDIEALDVERQELQTENQELQTELATIKANNTEIRAYIGFLEKLMSTQSSEKILLGEFDIESLVNHKEELISEAESLKDNEIIYFLGVMNSKNESETIGAYYKVIEYCIKDIKQKLE
jgi:predicted nuclease with TOPRIM domain